MPELFDPFLVKSLKEDKAYLETTTVPIITVSSSYREDLKEMHGFPAKDDTPDIVFSRAHYSMALAVGMAAWGKKMDPKKAWILDPTNYVSKKDWGSIVFTEEVGKLIARHDVLKTLKAFIDRFGRNKLPILESITPPLLYVTEKISGPILSFHIAAGNILAPLGKTVVQVITDPHVRDEYVTNAFRKNMYFCVFDENTKTEFLEKAALMGVKADPKRVFVTGAPIDPRTLAAKQKKNPYRSGVLKLCLTTGGLGTNKRELLEVVEQLLPELRKQNRSLGLVVYCATHEDIYKEVVKLAKEKRVAVGAETDKSAALRVLYHPQIVDANEKLQQLAFPWAHGFITKPSGDMAYDAAASGSFVLTLDEWGPWEVHIREIFEQKQISRRLVLESVVPQLESLRSAKGQQRSWIEQAMLNADALPSALTHGAKHIVEVVKNVS
ncbi:MAG: hypothetical protein H6773_04265 [Pseudomonadales bacterium]|nr:hypothetical protein [Pseudomonadales bacterium]